MESVSENVEILMSGRQYIEIGVKQTNRKINNGILTSIKQRYYVLTNYLFNNLKIKVANGYG